MNKIALINIEAYSAININDIASISLTEDYVQGFEDAMSAVDELLVEDVTAELINTGHGGYHGDYLYRCSNCGNESECNPDEECYCHHCGAKIVKVVEV